MLELYTYYRSVSAHRVRIALNHKAIPYQSVYIDSDSDEHISETYLSRNPQGLVPALVVDDTLTITQSSAILEYLEERYPERPLLPQDTADRARVRSFGQVLIADTNPLNILRVYRYMRDEMDLGYEQRRAWYEHWAHQGLRAVESLLGAIGLPVGRAADPGRPPGQGRPPTQLSRSARGHWEPRAKPL